MVAIGDDAEVRAFRQRRGCGGDEACETRVAVVQRGHGVECVGQACGTCLNAGNAVGVGGAGVAEGDFDVLLCERGDEGLGAFELRSYGDEFEGMV